MNAALKTAQTLAQNGHTVRAIVRNQAAAEKAAAKTAEKPTALSPSAPAGSAVYTVELEGKSFVVKVSEGGDITNISPTSAPTTVPTPSATTAPAAAPTTNGATPTSGVLRGLTTLSLMRTSSAVQA